MRESFEWHHASHNNKPASLCTSGILPVFIDYATFSEKVFVFGCSEMNVMLWMETAGSVFLNSMLLFLEAKGQKKVAVKIMTSGGISIVFLNGPFQQYFFLHSFFFCSEFLHTYHFPVFLCMSLLSFLACKMRDSRLDRVGFVSCFWPADPPSFILYGENYCQNILECMNRNCLFHFTANLWQMFWGGSHSH